MALALGGQPLVARIPSLQVLPRTWVHVRGQDRMEKQMSVMSGVSGHSLHSSDAGEGEAAKKSVGMFNEVRNWCHLLTL